MISEKYKNKKFVPITLQLIIDKLETINKTAYSLGIPRHRLLTKAIDAGMPLVVASMEAKNKDTKPNTNKN